MHTVEEFNAYCAGQTIAVVGDAESMIGLGNGEAIDAHDIVIRFNCAWPREVYYADTGRKTDVWCCAMFDIAALRQGFECLYGQIKFALWPWVNLNTAIEELYPWLVRLPPMHIVNLSASIGDVWATNGLAVIAWLWTQTRYKSIDVYGMDFLQSGCWSSPQTLDWATGKYVGLFHGPESENRHDGVKEKVWVKSNMARHTVFHGVEL